MANCRFGGLALRRAGLYSWRPVRSIVAMNPTGRLTLPAEVRRVLGLRGEAFFEVRLEGSDIVLKPVAMVPMETVRPEPARQPSSQ